MKKKIKDLTENEYRFYMKKTCFRIKCKDCPFNNTMCEINDGCWMFNKDLYSKKFLNQKVEIGVEELHKLCEEYYAK